MSKITYANKQTAVDPNNPASNEIFYATDANEVKASVNALYDKLDNIKLVDGFVSGPNLVATSTTNVAIQTSTQNVALVYNANGFQYTRNAGASDLTFTATADATYDKGCIIQANGTTISLKQGTASANVIYPTPDTGYVQIYSFIISTTGITSITEALANYVELNSINTGNLNLVGNFDVSGSIAQGSVISKVIKADSNGLLVGIDGTASQYIAGDGTLIPFPVAGQAGTLVKEVRNISGATMTKGTIVYINGANANKPTIAKALANSDATSARTFGLLQNDIANNSNGYCVVIGEISNLNTSSFTEGDQLYLSGTTAGAYTSTKTLAPTHLVYIGKVTRSHATLGQIEVQIQNGYELDEIHDVAISSVANNQGLFWESATSLWKNKSIATILGYTPLTDARTITINGTTQNLTANRTWSVGTLTYNPLNQTGSIPLYNGTNVLYSSQIYNDYANNFVGFGSGRTSPYNSELFGLNGGIYMVNSTNQDIMYVDNDTQTQCVLLIDFEGSILNYTGTYGTISDRTLKENITPATPKLDDLMKVNIVNYNLIEDENKLKQIGVIAQELEEVFPGLVSTDKKGIKSVKTSVMIPMLIKAMQEQQAQIDELKQLIK